MVHSFECDSFQSVELSSKFIFGFYFRFFVIFRDAHSNAPVPRRSVLDTSLYLPSQASQDTQYAEKTMPW